ncbi:MAG: Flagellar basal-body rod protein FlgC [bacterium ADurb.Bin363]|nr:MAG: Flagellar basal-body rod protein FlgC [bacterium ADurb.Bin363]
MGFFDAMEISASGMTAQRAQMDVISQNLANVNSIGEDGKAYKRKVAMLESEDAPRFVIPCGGAMGDEIRGASKGGRVKVSGVIEDQQSVRKVYDPGNPQADKQGFVEVSNVSVITEMTNMIQASRAYEANATSIQTAKKMLQTAMDIGKQ